MGNKLTIVSKYSFVTHIGQIIDVIIKLSITNNTNSDITINKVVICGIFLGFAIPVDKTKNSFNIKPNETLDYNIKISETKLGNTNYKKAIVKLTSSDNDKYKSDIIPLR